VGAAASCRRLGGQYSYNGLDWRLLEGSAQVPLSPHRPAKESPMSSLGAAPRAAVPLSPARAAASRRNGAKSCGPKTPEGARGAPSRRSRPSKRRAPSPPGHPSRVPCPSRVSCRSNPRAAGTPAKSRLPRPCKSSWQIIRVGLVPHALRPIRMSSLSRTIVRWGIPRHQRNPKAAGTPGETASLPASGPVRGAPARGAGGLRGPAFGVTFAAGREDAEGSQAGSPGLGRSGR